MRKSPKWSCRSMEWRFSKSKPQDANAGTQTGFRRFLFLGSDLQYGLRHRFGIMAKHVAFGCEVAGDAADTHGLNALDVRLNYFRTLHGVALAQRGRYRRCVEQRVIKHRLARMRVDALDVLRSGEVQAFVGLGHQVGDVDARALGGGQSLGNSLHQKIRDEAGVERAG